MTLQEYYKFPEGSNAILKFAPNWLIENSNVPCPSDLYYGFSYYKGTYIPPLNTSNVEGMAAMFSHCENLTYIDGIDNWDVSKVGDMSFLFSSCKSLPSFKLKGWNLRVAFNMSNMFDGCSNITSIDLSEVDTSNISNMNNMFSGCNKLKTISAIRADSLSIPSYQSPFGSSTNNVLTDFGGFINLKSSWNGSYCLDKLTALSHQSLVNILNGLYDFTGNGINPNSNQGKIKFGPTHLANLSDEEKAIATNKGWVLS